MRRARHRDREWGEAGIRYLRGRGVVLRERVRGSGDWWGRCPLHREEEASFHIEEVGGGWYCFGCRRGGGVMELIKELEGSGWREVLKDLGIGLSGGEGLAWERGGLRKEWDRYLAGWGKAPKEAAGYIEARGLGGLGGEAIGWASEGFFKGRLVVALGRRSEPEAIAGRLIQGEGPKWKFTKGWSASAHLAEAWRVGPGMAASRVGLVVVEGIMDQLKLAREGFRAVALLGARVSAEQLEEIIRIATLERRPVWVDLDGDEAGWKAQAELVVELLKEPLEVRLRPQATFSDSASAQDPDERIDLRGSGGYQAEFEHGLTGAEWLKREYRRALEAGRADLARHVALLVEHLAESLRSALGLEQLVSRRRENSRKLPQEIPVAWTLEDRLIAHYIRSGGILSDSLVKRASARMRSWIERTGGKLDPASEAELDLVSELERFPDEMESPEQVLRVLGVAP